MTMAMMLILLLSLLKVVLRWMLMLAGIIIYLLGEILFWDYQVLDSFTKNIKLLGYCTWQPK
jgi:hypothetical protein